MNTTIRSAIALAVLGLLLAGCGVGGGGGSNLAGRPAPDFSLPTVDGKTASLAELKGKVVVVDFWATWCPPCRESLPHLQQVSQNAALKEKGVAVLTVNAKENQQTVDSFLKKNGYTFPVALDASGSVLRAYGVTGIPQTVVIGRDGVVKSVFVGFGSGSAQALDQAIDAAIKGG